MLSTTVQIHGSVFLRLFRENPEVHFRLGSKQGHFYAGDQEILVKYSVSTRGPWQFTFRDQDAALLIESRWDFLRHLTLCLVCGGEVCVLQPDEWWSVLGLHRDLSAHTIQVDRQHGSQFQVSGSGDTLSRRVPLSRFPISAS